MSLSGLPLASFSLLSRSMVPPVTKSTGTPVLAVNFLATVSAIRSRQLPPQMLTTSLSCAYAGTETRKAKTASQKRRMSNSSRDAFFRIVRYFPAPTSRHHYAAADNGAERPCCRQAGPSPLSSPQGRLIQLVERVGGMV